MMLDPPDEAERHEDDRCGRAERDAQRGESALELAGGVRESGVDQHDAIGLADDEYVHHDSAL